MPKKRYLISVSTAQEEILTKALVANLQESVSGLFSVFLLNEKQRLERRGPGRPRNADGSEADPNAPLPEIYINPMDLPVLAGIPLSPAVDKDTVEGYYFRKPEFKMPPDYFTNPDYKHPNPNS